MASGDNRSVGFNKNVDSKFATKACHAGQEPEQWTYMDAVPPISVATTFKQKSPAEAVFEYGRSGNPGRALLERCLASLEDAKYGLCFSSGLGALTALVSTLSAGDHVLCVDDLYGGCNRFFRKIANRFNIESTLLSAEDPEKFIAAMKPNTKLVWLESPTNPMMKVWDVEKICRLAKQKSKDVLIGHDNTFLTFYFQKPLELGCDLVLYSATKYLNGHSDVIMGAITTNHEELYKKLLFSQNATGIVPSPLDCYLVNRSLKTLHVRMERHMSNGLAVARFLETHPNVSKVLHPGLPSHPHHHLALQQWAGCSGVLSFYHKFGLEESKSFLKTLKIFMLAESLGGYESLAELPAVMTHASVPADERQVLGITDNLIRLSVGLESASDLIEDLDQALNSLSVTKKIIIV